MIIFFIKHTVSIYIIHLKEIVNKLLTYLFVKTHYDKFANVPNVTTILLFEPYHISCIFVESTNISNKEDTRSGNNKCSNEISGQRCVYRVVCPPGSAGVFGIASQLAVNSTEQIPWLPCWPCLLRCLKSA